MKIVKTLSRIFLSIVGLILFLIIVVNILGTRSDIVPGLTGAKIKEVEPGMTLEQVISILGRPYKIGASAGLHNLECKNPSPLLDIDINNTIDIKSVVDNFYGDTNYCCEGNKEDMQNKEVLLTYSRAVRLSKHYPMLWVHLDSNFLVNSVFAKRYDGFLGFDDPAIYGLSWGLDAKTGEIKLDKTDFFIDEKAFKDCFN
jgi:hypothetical protein